MTPEDLRWLVGPKEELQLERELLWEQMVRKRRRPLQFQEEQYCLKQVACPRPMLT